MKDILKLLAKHEGYSERFGWGSSLERTERRRKDHSKLFDKDTEERIEKLFSYLFEDTKIEENDLKKLKVYIFADLRRFHNNCKRINEPTSRGCDLDITLKAITDNILRGIIKGFYITYSHSEKKLNYARDISEALDKIENSKDKEKINRKCKQILKIELEERHYDLHDIDKSHLKFNIKELAKLFTIDKKKYEDNFSKYKLTFDGLIKEEPKDNFEWYAKEIDINGFILALNFLDKSDNKTKIRKGLVGACSFIYAENNYKENNHWIIPSNSISKWAKVYGVDREVFSERIKQVKSCGFS